MLKESYFHEYKGFIIKITFKKNMESPDREKLLCTAFNNFANDSDRLFGGNTGLIIEWSFEPIDKDHARDFMSLKWKYFVHNVMRFW